MKTQEIQDVETNENNVKKRGQRCRVKTLIVDKSQTKQADLGRANIHSVLKKYEKTGLLPQRVAQPLQGVLPDVTSFHEAMTIVVQAQQTFDQLPSNIRQKFENDPAKFCEFANDPKNKDELVNLGLATQEPPEAPQPGLPPLPPEEPSETTQEPPTAPDTTTPPA